MNKTKRNIIQLRIKLMRKCASQIQPFEVEQKWLNQWYVKEAKTPLQTAGEVMQMKHSKLHSIFHKVCDYDSFTNTWGNLFGVKFPMIACVCKLDSNTAYMQYNKFLNKHHVDDELKVTPNNIKHVYQKRCKCCQNVYYKKDITSEQFDVFSGNDSIDVSFQNDTWIGEIVSCCPDCAED